MVKAQDIHGLYTGKCTHKHAPNTDTHPYTYTNKQTLTCTIIQTWTLTQTHIFIHTHKPVHLLTHWHKYTLTHTIKCTNMYTPTHTCTYKKDNYFHKAFQNRDKRSFIYKYKLTAQIILQPKILAKKIMQITSLNI